MPYEMKLSKLSNQIFENSGVRGIRGRAYVSALVLGASARSAGVASQALQEHVDEVFAEVFGGQLIRVVVEAPQAEEENRRIEQPSRCKCRVLDRPERAFLDASSKIGLVGAC